MAPCFPPGGADPAVWQRFPRVATATRLLRSRVGEQPCSRNESRRLRDLVGDNEPYRSERNS